MKNPAYMEVHQHNKTACQKSGQMVFFSQAVVSFCIELFCVVTLQYQILVRIAIAYFIIEKKKAAPQPWQAIAQRFCSTGIYSPLKTNLLFLLEIREYHYLDMDCNYEDCNQTLLMILFCYPVSIQLKIFRQILQHFHYSFCF